MIVNGIATIRAQKGETPSSLANRANISLTSFLKYNDLEIDHPITSGELYLLGKKKTKAAENFHKVQPDENLWSVSQHYGVQLKKLKKYNRISTEQQVLVGTTLWLNSKKPDDLVSETRASGVAEVDDEETFDWYTKSPITQDLATVAIPTMMTVETTIASLEVSSSDSVTFHEVLPGETLYAIAKIHKVSITDLLDWNSLSIQEGIKPGQVLKITQNDDMPVKESNPTKNSELKIHEVKSSDTLYSVARQYNVTIKEIMDWNNKSGFSLTLGEKLKIFQN